MKFLPLVALLSALVSTTAMADVRRFGPAVRTDAAPKIQRGLPLPAQTSRYVVRIDIDALHAGAAAGRLELPSNSAAPLFAQEFKERRRADGLLVWTGKVDTRFGPQSVTLTLGEGGVFGLIPQFEGAPLRIETRRGRTELVEGPQSLPDFAIDEDDFRRPPAPTAAGRGLRGRQDAAMTAEPQADGEPIVDVVVAYTPALVQVWGSNATVLARIAYLEEITNQAYVDSDVDQRIRVVGAQVVDYTFNNDNDDALVAISGPAHGGSNSTPIRLEVLRLRTLYGADLVKLMRNYDRSSQNSCGIAWGGGFGGAPFDPADGFSVTSDHGFGNDNCGDWTFAHELGHNMGAHHDVATDSEDGAFPYSHGLRATLSPISGFATVMAYLEGPQFRIGRFSNPRQNDCLGQACGNAATADNARSLNNTGALVAGFTPATPPSSAPALSVGDAQISEGNSGEKALAFTFNLSAPAAANVSINAVTIFGSATGGDFIKQETPVTVVIPAGQTSVVHNVMIRGDTIAERDEVFALNILSATNARLVDGQGVGTILNDEATPILSIDDVWTNEGNAGTTSLQFSVSVSQPSTIPVAFDVHSHEYAAGPTAATAGVDFDPVELVHLTIPAGEYSAQFDVPVHGDVLVENRERFYVMLNNIVGADAGDVIAVGNIHDDDGGAPEVNVYDAEVLEGHTGSRAARFLITRSGPTTAPLAIAITTSSVTAESGNDFVGFVGNVTIPAGESETYLDVATIPDTAVEGDETFRVTAGVGAGYELADAIGIGTLRDDDGVLPPLVALPDRYTGLVGVPAHFPVVNNDHFSSLRLAGGTLSIVGTEHGSTVAFSDDLDDQMPTESLIVTAPEGFFGEEKVTYRLCEGAEGGRCTDGVLTIHFSVIWVYDGLVAEGLGGAMMPVRAQVGESYVGAYSITPLVAPEVFETRLPADPTRETPWDGSRPGTQVFLATLPSTPGLAVDWRVGAAFSRPDAGPSTNGEYDIYIGRDTDGGNDADPDEVLCANANADSPVTSATFTDDCWMSLPHPGSGEIRYWILVHNRGNDPDTVRLEVFEIPMIDTDGSVVVSGPGMPDTGVESILHFPYSDLTLLPGDSRAAIVGVRGFPGAPLDYRVFYARNQNELMVAPHVLASGEALTLALPADPDEAPQDPAHERLFIDVPAGATRLEVDIASDQEVDLYLGKGLPEDAPGVGYAPERSAAVASATGPGGDATLIVEGAQLSAGRWFVTPVNTDDVPALMVVQATITANAPVVRPGSYFDAARSGHGLFLYPAGGDWAGLWYTYFGDGTPTWYYLQGPAPGANGIWDGGLYRAMWDGDSNTLVKVGRVLVTPTAADAFQFTFQLESETGSEPMAALGRGCPSISGVTLDVSSHWFNPATAGTGHSVQMFPDYEFYASFVYDRFGVPRFLTAESTSFAGSSAVIPLDQLTGFCPTCVRDGTPQRETVGTLTRNFSGGTFSSLGLQATFAGPLEGEWSRTEPVQALGGPGTTQGCNP